MVGATDEQSSPTFLPSKPSWSIGQAVAASAVVLHKPASTLRDWSASPLLTPESVEFVTKAGFEDVGTH